MRRLPPAVEGALRQATVRWRGRRLLRGAAWWTAGGALGWMLLDTIIWLGYLSSFMAAMVTAILLVVVLLAAALVILVAVAVAQPARRVMARSIEDARPSLLDRLNTLVWLDAGRGGGVPASYRDRIERQAGESLARGSSALPTAGPPVRWHVAVALACTLAALGLHLGLRPWDRLADREAAAGPAPAVGASSLKPPAGDSAEVQEDWGEVKVPEPGRDLTVTKVDVVPLRIEAAASDSLRATRYVTSAGRSGQTVHALPPPAEEHYASYRPLLYVDEFRLADWDVLTYHAAAETKKGRTYASDVYFLEVRPFREEILKLPGGEQGDAYRFLNELSGLIDRQKHVVRETHRHLKRPYETEAERRREQTKLAEAEGDLAEAARHVYARLAARLENADIGVVLDELAKAEGHLEKAARALAGSGGDVEGPARDALEALIATRKHLQKAISRDPSAWDDEAGDAGSLPALEGRLEEIAEFRDEEKATREVLERAAADQKRIREEAASPERRAELAEEQEGLRKNLAEWGASHPRMFRHADRERAATDEAMRRAAEALNGTADPRATQDGAVDALEALRRRIGRGARDHDLEQAYELRKLIGLGTRALAEIEADPDSGGAEEAARHAAAAKRATRELKRLLDETPAGDAFGEPLHDALSPARQAQREQRLDDVGRAAERGEREKAAGEASRALERLGDAFDRSQPGTARAVREEDALKEEPADALQRGLRQLEALAEELGSGEVRKDAAERRRQALLVLRRGLEGTYGKDAASVLVHMEEDLRADAKLDLKKVRRLLDEIEQVRTEVADRRPEAESRRLRHIDPSQLPPAYRDRIQRYFESLATESP